ncbi:hypothetical protein [Natronobeatus ordinarius]|uniref:hypothetical protein n=1 Tax=Natronobeatus ordinarius TaxID=2963433 RepID=UPI0020CB813D|nr:hypothetical protein [Natronobeatus ordinarius]
MPYERLARAFLEFDRVAGDDPVLLLVEAAASTTGQGYFTGVRATVERFRDAFVDPGRVRTFAALAALDPQDDTLVEAVGAQRKRHVLCAAATVLADRSAGDDLEALRSWAAAADVYRYDEDPIGAISGVGPATFQYLRLLAGVDTVKPDPQAIALVEAVADELESSPLDASEPLRTVASCEWLAIETSYRRIELDQLAWVTFADERELEAAAAAGIL